MCNFRLFLKIGQVLNRVESTEFSRPTTGVYTQEYPITVSMVGIGQMSRLNCSLFTYIRYYNSLSNFSSYIELNDFVLGI